MFLEVHGVDVAPPQALESERASDEAFRIGLLASIPSLRAFGRLLSGNVDTADDLVQETMVKAWAARARFIPGTKMGAWTHVILRNVYYSQNRRGKFIGAYNQSDAEMRLAVPASQDAHVPLSDLARAMQQLPVEQREVLIMIGGGGMSCEDAAAICGCPFGTVKSRLSRARTAVRALLDNGQLARRRAKRPATMLPTLDQIMREAVVLSQPRTMLPVSPRI